MDAPNNIRPDSTVVLGYVQEVVSRAGAKSDLFYLLEFSFADKALSHLKADAKAITRKIQQLDNAGASVLGLSERIKIFMTRLFCWKDTTAEKLEIRRNELNERLSINQTAEAFLQNDANRGVLAGMDILELQKKLSGKGLSLDERKQISDQIAETFENEEDYAQMLKMRETIDNGEIGTSLLHQLVFKDLQVEYGHRVIRAINDRANESYDLDPTSIQFYNQVYSDVDDTIKGSLKDMPSRVKGFYPSVLQFFREVTNAQQSEEMPKVRFTLLSARPDAGEKIWNKGMRKKLPQDINFFALYGSTPSFKKGIGYYLISKPKKFIAKRLPDWSWLEGIKDRLLSSSDNKEIVTYSSFAQDKRKNIDRDLLLRPEARPIMTGDCGEGDMIFLLAKNCGAPSIFGDERIPEEYETKWRDGYAERLKDYLEELPDSEAIDLIGRTEDEEEQAGREYIQAKKQLRAEALQRPGNYPDKPLWGGFGNYFSTPSDFGDARPNPIYAIQYKSELNVNISRNYVDAGVLAHQAGLIDDAALERIVEDSRKWLADQKWVAQPEADVTTMSSKNRFRELLSRSVQSCSEG